jgi:hypothetical protein
LLGRFANFELLGIRNTFGGHHAQSRGFPALAISLGKVEVLLGLGPQVACIRHDQTPGSVLVFMVLDEQHSTVPDHPRVGASAFGSLGSTINQPANLCPVPDIKY